MPTFDADYLDRMYSAYAECGLWASSCNGDAAEFHDDCPGQDCDKGLDVIGFVVSDIAVETEEDCRTDCAAFLASVSESNRADEIEDSPWSDPAQMGHDFWLTRNHHGAGFWDRGAGGLGKFLTDLAHPYGDYSFYVDGGEVRGE